MAPFFFLSFPTSQRRCWRTRHTRCPTHFQMKHWSEPTISWTIHWWRAKIVCFRGTNNMLFQLVWPYQRPHFIWSHASQLYWHIVFTFQLLQSHWTRWMTSWTFIYVKARAAMPCYCALTAGNGNVPSKQRFVEIYLEMWSSVMPDTTFRVVHGAGWIYRCCVV